MSSPQEVPLILVSPSLVLKLAHGGILALTTIAAAAADPFTMRFIYRLRHQALRDDEIFWWLIFRKVDEYIDSLLPRI